MRGIAPAEGDVAFGERDQPGVRDGDAMGVGAEITQPMFRSTEGRLGVDDPIVAEWYPHPCREGARMSLQQKLAVELELTSVESVARSGEGCRQ
jgi:hypothetical protein